MNHLEKHSNYIENITIQAVTYLGLYKKCTNISETIGDEKIIQVVNKVKEEVDDILIKEYNSNEDLQKEMSNITVEKVVRPYLNNDLLQVAKDAEIKLKRDGTLVKMALTGIKNGKMPYYISKIIATAYYIYNLEYSNEKEISESIMLHGIKETIATYSEISEEKELLQMIVDHYKKLIKEHGITEDDRKISIMKRAFEEGFNYELTIKGCAQCTLAALFEVTGDFNEILFQSAGGLAGGMALSGDGSCGGYSGGIMLMGSFIGRRFKQIAIDGDKEAKYKSYEMSQKLHDRFIETYGSVICKDIHKSIFGKSYCIRNKEESLEFEAAGAHTTKCTTVVGNASAWVAEILIGENII